MKQFFVNRFPIILLCLAFTKVGYSQESKNSISGYVYDKSSGEPIEDVNIYVSNTTWGSSTNKEGYYRIKQIPMRFMGFGLLVEWQICCLKIIPVNECIRYYHKISDNFI